MCNACEDVVHERFSIDHPVVLQAREIERAMGGERVPDSAWRVYLGTSNEPISWKHFERVRAAMDDAKARPVHPTLTARPSGQAFVCESVA